jgi:hypothetical protein
VVSGAGRVYVGGGDPAFYGDCWAGVYDEHFADMDPGPAVEFLAGLARARPGRAVRHPRQPHQWPTCASHGCRSMPVSPVRVQTMHPDPANEPPTDDQEGLTAFWRSGL